MLKVLSDVLAGLTGRESEPRVDERMLTAAAVVAHLALVDGQITARERAWLRAAIRTHVGLEGSAADAYLERAVTLAQESGDLTGLVADLRHRLEPAQKRLLIAELWRLALADGDLHEFEDTVIGRAADLLGVPSDEALLIRKDEMARLQG
jgi:uncharacterized tellurite resistance protein B-like protein